MDNNFHMVQQHNEMQTPDLRTQLFPLPNNNPNIYPDMNNMLFSNMEEHSSQIPMHMPSNLRVKQQYEDSDSDSDEDSDEDSEYRYIEKKHTKKSKTKTSLFSWDNIYQYIIIIGVLVIIYMINEQNKLLKKVKNEFGEMFEENY